MKLLFQILLITFNCCLMLGQKSVKNQNKLNQQIENLIKEFPKTINNQSDFDVALSKISKIRKICDTTNSLNDRIDKLIVPSKNLIIWSEKNASFEEKIKCKLFYLIVNSKMFNIKEIIETGNELLNYKDNLSKYDMFIVVNSLTIGYRKSEAFNDIIKITPLRKKYAIQQFTEISDIENDLALAYYNSKNYKSAASSFLTVKKYYLNEKDYLYAASESNNAGLCYLKLYDFVNAKRYFDLALQELKLTNGIEKAGKPKGYNDFFKSVINSNIAKIEVENGNFEKAIFSYKDLIKKTRNIGGSEKYNIGESFLNISKIQIRKNNVYLANAYLDSTKISLDKIVSTSMKIDINNLEASICLLNKNPSKAAKFLDASKKTTDSIAQIQIGRENILAQAKYKSDEKDQELDEMKIENKSKSKISFLQKIGLTITTILLATIGFLYFRTLIDKRTIKQQKDSLTISLTEKETLLKELHHRVKNNLQVITGLLQLKSKKVNSPEMQEILDDSQRQINSMALVHEMLYRQDDFATVPIHNYIQKLTQQILGSFLNHNIQVFVGDNDINLSINKAIPIGLIISELMTNTYKYAFDNKSGEITIAIKNVSPNEYQFIYCDNGKGLPENFKENHNKTMGMKLLHLLAEEMNATLEIESNQGMSATIKFADHEKV